VILADREAEHFSIEGLRDALTLGSESSEVEVRLFGKPTTRPYRRMGVALASGATVDEARERARQAAGRIHITYSE
jgi:phosphoribosylglycinamide formyltransferase 2